ncbi:cell surface receptor IPT/TIG domain protein [Paenibacillus curdlanolyticus YK9]|uniref:Cell surface receptor IPT/TIG domain protein n=1 Tax=Paenibacillus curdlanolyticus YK9 TaxID=717606 RepID=E0I6C7_9BACL|nr:cell surface receptor IPT/TIG domain protein [Paenibacillus curdlanolyticus YK9]
MKTVQRLTCSVMSLMLLLSFLTFIPHVNAISAPTVTSLSPNSGQLEGGDLLYVNGSNFASGAKVYFGSVQSPSVTLSTSARLKATVPAGTALGAVDVTVVNADGGQATLIGGYTYVAPPPPPSPAITTLSPNYGVLAGGDTIYVNGSNFVNGAKVFFGSIEATAVTYTSSVRLKATVPAGAAAGTVDVTVKNPNGTEGTLANGYTYLAPATAPVLTDVSPNSYALTGGLSVYINGSNFSTGSRVLFGSNEATGVTYVSSTKLIAIVPAGAALGLVDVTVIKADGAQATLANGFTYIAPPPPPAPSITTMSFYSGSLAGGESLYLNGSNFTSGTVVYFGSNLAYISNHNSSVRLTVIVPAGTAAGAVDVKVVNPNGTQAILSNGYTYLAPPPPPAPVITSLSDNSGYLAGGLDVYVNGSNYNSGTKVFFGSIEATNVTFLSAIKLKVTVPASAVLGSVDVTVINPDATQPTQGTLVNGYTYKLLPTPTITGVSPNSGQLAGGETVYINGSDFSAGSKVYFGTKEAALINFSSTQLAVHAPSSTSVGAVDVSIVNYDGTQGMLTNGYTYLALPAPEIDQVAPNSGLLAGGEHVFISGSHYQQGVKVYFGTAEASIVTYYADGYLEVLAPESLIAGAVDVQVVNPDNQSVVLASAYTYRSAADPNERQDTLNDVGNVQITSITAANEGRVDYGSGEKWRAGSAVPMTVEGVVYDDNGNPLSNEHMSFRFLGHITPGTAKQVEFVTDANGHFRFQFVLPPAVGEESYSLPLSTHYFDIVEIQFYEGKYDSSDAAASRFITNASDSSIYHFAYSYYHG